jgi:hypothetical protein
MKSGRSLAAEQTRARLLDLWKGEEAFGRPLGCVTTSFTFDAELFEEQCLARFLSIQSNPNETAKAYLIEREKSSLIALLACSSIGHMQPRTAAYVGTCCLLPCPEAACCTQN